MPERRFPPPTKEPEPQPVEANGDGAPKEAEGLSINLFDLDRVDPFIREQLRIAERIDRDRGNVVRVDEKRVDETAVAFTCDLITAATICEIIRNHDRKAGDYPTRVYVRRAAGGKWEKLPNDALLTLVAGEKVVLNPRWFPKALPKAKSSPKPVTRVQLGNRKP